MVAKQKSNIISDTTMRCFIGLQNICSKDNIINFFKFTGFCSVKFIILLNIIKLKLFSSNKKNTENFAFFYYYLRTIIYQNINNF